MALLPVPFVWGPVGGGETLPRGFWSSFSFRGKVFEIFRALARCLGEFDPFVRLTARRAALALCMTAETAARLERIGCRRVAVWPEAGLPPEDISQLGALPSKNNHKPFRILSSGNLLHWKGTQLGLQAFAALHEAIPNTQYWIIGDGPERRRLQKLVEKLMVADSVTFWGALPRQEGFEKLAACDVLMHPSIHDSAGWVCLEAMAAGRPVVCLDLGGPAFQVSDNTGIRIPARSPVQAVEDIAAALKLLARDPALCSRMGLAGQVRVSEHFNRSQMHQARTYFARWTGQGI